MVNRDILLDKVKRYKELKNQMAILKAESDSLNTEIKEMIKEGDEREFILGNFVVKLQEISKDRFDSKTFKLENEFLYNQFLRPVNEERLQVTGGDI